MIVRNLKCINIIYNEEKFDIYCKKPLKLNEIKDLIRKKINSLDKFELKYRCCILTLENLDSIPIKELTVVTNNKENYWY